ncbi:MAG: hypothetical protein R3266_03990, partial [Gemmatimonadota bacterium]|nr:hypothetical protein [Gemmatimonadota bacterium]
DLPEAIEPLAVRQLLSLPWRYWRYPLGAQRRRHQRLYDAEWHGSAPPAADPRMQIKAPAIAEDA